MIKKIIIWFKDKWYDYKMEKAYRKKVKELKKRDPFIYK